MEILLAFASVLVGMVVVVANATDKPVSEAFRGRKQ